MTRPNCINTTLVEEDTPEKKKKAENRNQTSSPKSPCLDGSPSELPPLI